MGKIAEELGAEGEPMIHQCPLCPSLAPNLHELERHRLLFHPDHQAKLILNTIERGGKIYNRIYEILKQEPSTRPRAKRSYKMLYWFYTRSFGTFPNASAPSEEWLNSADEQSLGRIKRMVLEDHPELLNGMDPLKQERAYINEQVSEEYYGAIAHEQ